MSIVGWLPADWSKAILPLATRNGERFNPIGTGFLLGHFCEGLGFNCLVTAKHVIMRGDGQLRDDLFVLLNKVGQGIDFLRLSTLFENRVAWIKHPEKDVAAIPMPADVGSHDAKKFSPDLIEDFSRIVEGDDIFFLGFPLGIAGTERRITPIVRSGMIAMKNEDETFLVDANVFPGNSGSPVFFKPCPFRMSPEGYSLGDMRPPKLIGVVTSYILYEDVAVSQQSGRARVSFQENSGLANVLSMRFVSEVLNSTAFTDMLHTILRNRQPPPS